jgi:hypothetical protein
LHYFGQQASGSQFYVNRNAVFETNLDGFGADHCLPQIAHAFRFGKPAIISNHRASFVGGVEEKNRIQGLRQLDSLLGSIVKRWPDVEFIDMADLHKIMTNTRND